METEQQKAEDPDMGRGEREQVHLHQLHARFTLFARTLQSRRVNEHMIKQRGVELLEPSLQRSVLPGGQEGFPAGLQTS